MRSPLPRKSPMSSHKSALQAGEKKLRTRKCAVKGCGNRFVPRSITHKACGEACAEIVAAAKRKKEAARAAKVERQKDQARKEALLTIPELKAIAQKAFNAFRREWCRVNGYVTCPCCDEPLDWNSNAVDCGHYRSTGSADHMRFVEDNAWAQRKQCNRYGAGRAVDYRIGLIKRIGIERVEALESNNTVIKWTREILIAKAQEYRAKLKALKAGEAG